MIQQCLSSYGEEGIGLNPWLLLLRRTQPLALLPLGPSCLGVASVCGMGLSSCHCAATPDSCQMGWSMLLWGVGWERRTPPLRPKPDYLPLGRGSSP